MTVTPDLLDLLKINALPQPLMARLSGVWWPVYDIDVSSGLVRLDISGQLQVEHIGGILALQDACGGLHDSASFYTE